MNSSFISRTFVTVVTVALSSVASAQIDNFDSLNGYAAGLELRLNSEHQGFFELRAPKAGFAVGLEGSTVNRDISPANDRLKRENQAQFYGFNASWGTETWNIGASIIQTETSSDYLEINSPAPTPTSGTVDSDSLAGRIWLLYHSGDLSLTASLTSSSSDYTGSRRSDLGASSAKFDGSGSFGLVKIAYDLSLSDKIAVTPFAGIIWAKAKADGFTEGGTAADRRIVGKFDADESNAAVGVRIGAKDGAWKPALTLGWLNELSSDAARISVKAINGFDLGVGSVPNASESMFYAGLQLRGDLDDNWSVRGSVDYFTGGDEQQTGFSLGIRRGF